MVNYPQGVQASNAQISSLPPGLITVFFRGTSGIDERPLKQFTNYARQLRIYFVGREQAAADCIISELKVINSKGQYTFIKVVLSLIKVVDDVCKDIMNKETVVYLLFLTPGSMISGTGH